MSGFRNDLPPVPPDEPPHPNFWDRKWPYPRFGRREPDKLLVKFMQWYNLQPSEFRGRKSRYQYVNTGVLKTQDKNDQKGKFRCFDRNCLGKNGKFSFWTSKMTWVRFDMKDQTVRVFGQKCMKCEGKSYGGRYCYPLPFYYVQWRAFCIKAIDKAQRNMYLKDDILVGDIDEGAFSSLTEEEQQQIIDSIVRKLPHPRELCQRCTERKGPCLFPHKPDDCLRCQNDPRGLCYDPKQFQ